MTTVLVAWELGEGLGHVGPMKALADRLAAEGCSPVFAVRDVVSTRGLLAGRPYPVLQAPLVPNPMPPWGRPFGISGYADILAIHAFNDEDQLFALAQAWQDLFDAVRPQLIVSDHSPTACLAAYDRLPVVQIGSGFTLPPAHLEEFPALRPDVPAISTQGELLDVVRRVQQRRKRRRPDRLTDILDTAGRVLGCVAELDPYRTVREDPWFGPFEDMPSLQPMADGKRLFGYLSGDFGQMDDLSLAMSGLGLPVEVYVRGPRTSVGRFLARRGVVVHERPPALPDMLGKASHVLSHGGATITHAALAAGRPHLVMPRHLEAALTAQAVEDLGAGVNLLASVNRVPFATSLPAALNREDLAPGARAAASRIFRAARTDALEVALQACLEAVGEALRPGDGPASATLSDKIRRMLPKLTTHGT